MKVKQLQSDKFQLILNKKEKRAELKIYDVIGEPGGITANSIINALKEAGDYTTIDVYINSPGGITFDGITIYNELKQNPATVNVYVYGIAASAASIIAMAGDSITMAEGSFIMIHRSIGMTYGDVNDHAEQMKVLQVLDDEIASIYSARSDKPTEEIIKWMDESLWMNADEAIAKGFADYKISDNNKVQAMNLYNWLDEYKGLQPNKIAAKLFENNIKKYENNRKEKDMTIANEVEPTPKVANINDLRGECIGADSEFILQQLEQGVTLEKAKTNFIAKLNEKIKAQQDEINQLKNEINAKKPGVNPVEQKSNEVEVDPIIAYESAIENYMKLHNVSKPEAALQIARSNSDLRMEYIDAYNNLYGGK